ncbi:MAG: alpha/beta hydrolase [Rhodocyclaceae bacterium]|nr:alpha/beta hydrolase [Rhodocyclaceae bacterium]
MSVEFIAAQGHRLEYVFIHGTEAAAPTLVFLHEGLGSVAMWRDFPRRLVAATGCTALVYSRYGYGRSDPLTAPRRPDFMHAEGLRALPELLDGLAIARPVLIGHSDGASIALIHAGGAGRPLAGVIAMAPHVMVEDVAIASIEAARRAYETGDFKDRLARYHDDVDSAFRGWNDIWLDPAFRAWNIEEFLPRIDVPVLAIQGLDDEYGTMAQLERVARCARDVETLKLADCRHSPHRDQPQAVIDAVAAFVQRLGRA